MKLQEGKAGRQQQLASPEIRQGRFIKMPAFPIAVYSLGTLPGCQVRVLTDLDQPSWISPVTGANKETPVTRESRNKKKKKKKKCP